MKKEKSQYSESTNVPGISEFFVQKLLKKLKTLPEKVEEIGEKTAFQWVNEMLALYQGYRNFLSANHEEHFKKAFQQKILVLTNQSAVLKYCYDKPRGYAGDFGAMELIWSGRQGPKYCGYTGLGAYLNAFTLETDNCRANEYRVYYLKDRLIKGSYKIIASIGSGSALEIVEAVRDGYLKDSEIHLFDQDDGALDTANFGLRDFSGRLVIHRGNVLRTILKEKEKGFDFIYSSGMFDYFDITSAKKLTQRLWSKLAPGGCLLITNAHPENPTRLWVEYVTEWDLEYKDSDEMKSMSEDLNDLKNADIDMDPYGVYQYLSLYKR
ncbi:MAG TPA: class I SAM-dependent methyltransferase [Nitrospirae bacterium]|nr:class I SAM-dependent methyltransferase [Nitrospirota bacterium]